MNKADILHMFRMAALLFSGRLLLDRRQEACAGFEVQLNSEVIIRYRISGAAGGQQGNMVAGAEIGRCAGTGPRRGPHCPREWHI